MSNLEIHAEREMRRAGLYDQGSDYDGMIPEAVMKLVRAHASEGHSGMSHAITIQIFNQVINFKTLTPLTSDPSEWMEVDTGKMWQSLRHCSCFSTDGGKTYYDLDDEPRTIKTAKDPK